MDIILLEKVQNLGNIGEQVKVRAGYGRNFLIPQRKAVPATKDNVTRFEAERAEHEKAASKNLAMARSRAEKLTELSIEISSKAGDEGKLFGSVSARDIASATTSTGVEVSKSEILLPDGPLHNVGEFEIGFQLHPDVKGVLKVQVVAE